MTHLACVESSVLAFLTPAEYCCVLAADTHDVHVNSIETCHLAQVLFENQGRASKNKAVDLEDMKFHQCVRLTRFENDRTISFIPPDGAFDLMCAPT